MIPYRYCSPQLHCTGKSAQFKLPPTNENQCLQRETVAGAGTVALSGDGMRAKSVSWRLQAPGTGMFRWLQRRSFERTESDAGRGARRATGAYPEPAAGPWMGLTSSGRRPHAPARMRQNFSEVFSLIFSSFFHNPLQLMYQGQSV